MKRNNMNEEQEQNEMRRETVAEAEKIMKQQLETSKQTQLAEERAFRGDAPFRLLPPTVVEDLRRFEITMHEVIKVVEFEGRVGRLSAWVIRMHEIEHLMLYDNVVEDVVGYFEVGDAALSLVGLIFGIVHRRGATTAVLDLATQGDWP